MAIIIDGHQDLAVNMLAYGRDYRRSARETRAIEKGSKDKETGAATLGWHDYQRGQVAVIFATLFAAPRRLTLSSEDSQVYDDYDEAHRLYRGQLEFYRRWTDQNSDLFRLISSQTELNNLLALWDHQPADPQENPLPVGLVILMEGADGVRDPAELEEWWELGLRQIGPAWLSSRYCGGTAEDGSFSREGFALLDRMAALGFTLDISHMNMISALQALDRYQGAVIASHSNARAMIKGEQGRWSERHLTDDVLRRLIERGGITGLVPFNKFLVGDWDLSKGKNAVTLEHVAQQVDYVCQMAGNAAHVAIGTDFDGGFGSESVPCEVDTIADLQKLVPLLEKRGYTETDIQGILSGNWRRHLEQHLPSA